MQSDHIRGGFVAKLFPSICDKDIRKIICLVLRDISITVRLVAYREAG